jgi:hypothetical protein
MHKSVFKPASVNSRSVPKALIGVSHLSSPHNDMVYDADASDQSIARYANSRPTALRVGARSAPRNSASAIFVHAPSGTDAQPAAVSGSHTSVLLSCTHSVGQAERSDTLRLVKVSMTEVVFVSVSGPVPFPYANFNHFASPSLKGVFALSRHSPVLQGPESFTVSAANRFDFP